MPSVKECFVDEHSLEQKTGIIKRKYKLLCSNFGGAYTFLVSYGSDVNCINQLTLYVRDKEWSNRNPAYLKGTSYFDLRRSLQMTETELTAALATSPDFMKVAELPNSKFGELQVIMRSARARTFRDPRHMRALTVAILGVDLKDEFIKKFNL